MFNRQFYTLKFKSSRLREFDYKVDVSFNEAKELGELIALADTQILRSIRDIEGYYFSYDEIENLYRERKRCEKKLSIETEDQEIKAITDKLSDIKTQINQKMFVSEYITVVMEHPSHYRYIFKNGFFVNGVRYRRFSCGAGQARVSTVAFVSDDVREELMRRLNNGRDTTAPLAPSKFNAYFGLYGSATHVVSEPKFIVVKDFQNETEFMCNYVTETDWDKDDIVEVKSSGKIPMNRTDGMGLISPVQSKKWADELGLDYAPSQWCVRQSFIKGMLCTFDIHDFCEKINGNNYVVDTIYKDKNGEYIKADLRDYDVIISESQFKLWDSYHSIDAYIENCHKNKLQWGVTQFAPKEANNKLKMNYQFIQTLNLNRDKIEDLCKDFVDWIEGVTYDNVPYLLLFLLGVNNTEDKIREFIKNGQNYWVKSLLVNPHIRNDRYVCFKIKNLIKKKIQNGCRGEIFVDGNFQVLVSDPYGFMQHVCGQKVTGLLRAGEFYSNYWNERGVSEVDAMRSPLTYRSEHVILNLRKDEEVDYWYRYCKLGIILNYHGHECVNFAGADFDFDILATTSNKTVINGVYRDEFPVMYDAPKPKKILFTDEDLYKSDVFSFGSIIGSITNKSSNAYALLPNIEKEYGADSDEYRLVISRLQQCCKAQSAQIDKAKIGKEVKNIPQVWVNKQLPNVDSDTGEILDTGDELRQKDIYDRTLLNKRPYFFKYVYPDAKRKYNKYVDECESTCHQRFKISLNSLIKLQRKTIEQKEFLRNYFRFMPLTYSDSSMNLLCVYIEGINFNIWQKVKETEDPNIFTIYKNHNKDYSRDSYKEITDALQEHIKKAQSKKQILQDAARNDESEEVDRNDDDNALMDKMLKICEDPYVITNCLVDYFYIEKPSMNKDILWDTCGKYMCENVISNTNTDVLFPFPDDNGEIKYMGRLYSLRKVC